MAKLYVLRGLPASGKTTKAIELVKTNNCKRVSRDDIRSIGGIKDEKKVVYQEDTIIADCLKNGDNVVVDDTNLNPARVARLREISESCSADIEIVSFLTPPDVCVARDSRRSNPVGAPAIWSMYHKYLKGEKHEHVSERPV